MNGKRLLPLFAAFAILASACTQQNSGDEASPSTAPQGLNRFLLFPNPVAMSTGGFETNTTAYASAYYAAIDPNNLKDTIGKWKQQNGFGSGIGTEALAVFRDTKDLGYGRRMTGRMNTDGSVAFFVENYNVAPNATSGGYASLLNVEAAIRRDTQWHVGTNAIEWSSAACTPEDPADCNGTVKFAKYYNFSSRDGTRQLAVDLDGNGLKAMPGPCITCHGGRGDPLTPDEGTPAKPRFPLVENSASRKRGDVQARLHGMNVDSFGYSPDIQGFSKSAQQATLKEFNQWILCTYPAPGGATVSGAWGTCTRPTAGANEWQGTAGPMIEAWYGGTGMPQSDFLDDYVPAQWQAANVGQPAEDLYRNVVAPYCRTCHVLRGTNNQNDIDFMTRDKFMGYADRIRAHVFDRGTMPLALIVYDDFWGTNAPNLLANAINPALAALVPPLPPATDSKGIALRPGRPVANPGPNRMARTNAPSILTAENSLFASSWRWEVTGGSGTIANPDAMITTFTPTAAGDATIRLTVGNGSLSDSKSITITADNNFPNPASLKFAQVKNVMQNFGAQKCVSCHTSTAVSPIPPVFYNAFDRNNSGGPVDATDDDWFLKAVRGRVNLTEIDASPLLRKPSGNHHNGGNLLNVTDKSSGGGLSSYSVLYQWILAGMPSGGLIASAGADSTNNIDFGTANTISLDGSGSIGATGYAWSIVSFTPAAHPNGTGNSATPPSITNAGSQSATLNVFDIGSYVVRLTVSNGADPDAFADRTITVTETAVVASASPSGTQALTFLGSPTPTATLNLSSAGTTGDATAYSWIYFPSGLTTGPCGTISNPTSATATLTVPSTDIGNTCSFRVFASNLSTTGNATTTITIAAAAGQNPTASWTATTTTRCSVTNGATAAPSAACTWAGNPFNATIGLSGTASGVGTLTFQWSILGGSTAGGSITNATSQTATLNFVNAGTYFIRLFVDNGALSTGTTVDKTITVTANRTFTQVRAVFTGPLACVGCHAQGNPATFVAVNSGIAPSWENVNDTNGNTLYQRVLARVNLAAPASSLLVLNPLGSSAPPNTNGHGGGQLFADENDANYITFLTWIIGGAPNN